MSIPRTLTQRLVRAETETRRRVAALAACRCPFAWGRWRTLLAGLDETDQNPDARVSRQVCPRCRCPVPLLVLFEPLPNWPVGDDGGGAVDGAAPAPNPLLAENELPAALVETPAALSVSGSGSG